MPKSRPPSGTRSSSAAARRRPPAKAGKVPSRGPAKAISTKAASTKAGSTKATSPKTTSAKAALKAPDSAVKLTARVRRLTARLAAAKDRIQELEGWAQTDALLDIPNRRGFERELNRAIAYLRRYQATGALIALDVDRLKPINDTFGHAAGDAVLKGIVNVVLRHIRSSDVVGRLGGDEFAVLLWNLTEADALLKAAALEDAIDRLTFVFRGRSLNAGASTGVTMLAPADDAAAALERADRAMYARKDIRRNRLRDPERSRS